MTVPAAELRAELERRAAELRAGVARAAGRRPVLVERCTVDRLGRNGLIHAYHTVRTADRMREAALARVEAALRRLDAGDYGRCAACGEPIAPRRLAADPATADCIDCAEAAATRRGRS